MSDVFIEIKLFPLFLPYQREQVCQVDVKFVLIPWKDSLVDLVSSHRDIAESRRLSFQDNRLEWRQDHYSEVL